MRAFIALELPSDIREELASTRDRLDTRGVKIKWTRPENMHLTLKFLGDISGDQAEQIVQLLEKLELATPMFQLKIGGLGAFPNKNKPRVIWAGVSSNDHLLNLHGRINEIAEQAGIEPDTRKYSPHLTLGRVKQINRNSKLTQSLKSTEITNRKVTFSEVILFKSTLTPDGPMYSKLSVSGLKDVGK